MKIVNPFQRGLLLSRRISLKWEGRGNKDSFDVGYGFTRIIMMQEPYRVIHLASTKRLTGVAEPMVNLAFYQKALGHDVILGFERGRSLEKYVKGMGLSILPDLHLDGRLNPFHIMQDVRRLRRHIETLRPDVVHCHLLHDHWIAVLAARGILPRPLVLRTMHRFVPPYHDPFHRHLFTGLTDGIIVPSEAMRRLFLRWYPRLAPHVFVIRGGVNLERYRPDVDRKRLRRELEIPEDAPVAGIVARLRKDRGIDWLFASLPHVLSSVPKCRIVIVGQGELQGKIRNIMSEPPFQGYVVMAGYRTHDLPLAYGAMDVSLFLGLGSEGSCRAVMEAMACGIPVIGVDKGAVPEIISEGVTGFVVPEGDERLLTERLCELLSNRKFASDMGQAARQRADNLFRLYDKALQMCDVYLALKQGRHLP